MRFTTTVSHTVNSTGPASQVSFYNPVSGLSIDLDTITPDPFSSSIKPVITASQYTLNPGVLEGREYTSHNFPPGERYSIKMQSTCLTGHLSVKTTSE